MPTMKPLLMIPLFFALGACEEDDEPVMPEPQTLVEVTQSVNTETGEFSTLLAAVTEYLPLPRTTSRAISR